MQFFCDTHDVDSSYLFHQQIGYEQIISQRLQFFNRFRSARGHGDFITGFL